MNMTYLTPQERQRLQALHRVEKKKVVWDRIKTILALDEGFKPEEVARILLLSVPTVYRYMKEYQDEQKLTSHHKGSESHLNTEQTQALIKHLKEKTYLCVKEIAQYIQNQYGISYTRSGLTQWLHEHAFRYKKPYSVPCKIDVQKQKEFIEFYKKLRRMTQQQNIPLYFADGVHPQYQTQLAYGWLYKGSQKRLPNTPKQTRIHLMGGIEIASHHVQIKEFSSINKDAIQDFLHHLRNQHPLLTPIHIIWDNANDHKNSQVKAVAKELNIELHFLPPYSPNLNPIERLWHFMRKKILYNTYYQSFQAFKIAINHFFHSLSHFEEDIKSLITEKFHILAPPATTS